MHPFFAIFRPFRRTSVAGGPLKIMPEKGQPNNTPPPPPFPKGGEKPIRNQEAKAIAEKFMRECWAEFHPMAVRQIVRNCVSIADREIKRAQVEYQVAKAESGKRKAETQAPPPL